MNAPHQHSDDQDRLRHARARHEGFAVGSYLQPPPMLFTRDGHNVFLGDMYRGRSAFLLCSGPSLKNHDLDKLNQYGFLTCSVNNAAVVHRTNLWVSADDPGNFCDVIWRDPGILKFVPLCHMEKPLSVRDSEGELVESAEVVGDMPGVFGFRRNESFNAETWLNEDTFNWGNHSQRVDKYGNKGSRSIMYIALRLLHYLGVRRLFLLGCDFKMEHDKDNYAFEQARSSSSVRGNNSSYRVLNERLRHLLPVFQHADFEIINCTPDSGLAVFPHVSFEKAVESVKQSMPQRIITRGMYDRKASKITSGTSLVEKNSLCRGSELANLPEMTLVVDVVAEDLCVLKETWRTWGRFKPWLHSLPLLILHDPAITRADLAFLRDAPRMQTVSLETNGGESLRDARATGIVKLIAKWVETPWYLRLDPKAVATGDQPWVASEWFVPRDAGLSAAFISCPWGYSKPADAFAALNEWAKSVPELSCLPEIEFPYDPQSDRVEHVTINSWCFFGNAQWTREIANYVGDTLPHPAHSTFVHYCALRRQDHYVTVQLKDCGWEHHFRSAKWFLRRCRQVMS